MALTLPGIAKLRNAALVLRETTGFAYLPIIVPHEVAGRDVLQELQRASAVGDDQWHEVVWPKAAIGASPWLPLTPETTAEQREALAGQRKALLQSFDAQLLQDAHAGHALVLDASPSTRQSSFTVLAKCANGFTSNPVPRMPSFFAYMLWAAVVLIPVFVLTTFLFFR